MDDLILCPKQRPVGCGEGAQSVDLDACLPGVPSTVHRPRFFPTASTPRPPALRQPPAAGQSNMAFSIGANENKKDYIAEANKYPTIRLFTVGTKTSSKVPLMDLHTISQNWSVASNKSISDGSEFGRFSAVCWFFGKNVHDKLNGTVPVGLVSDNWGGTPVEDWTTPESTAVCGHASSGNLYNAMIVPYSVGR